MSANEPLHRLDPHPTGRFEAPFVRQLQADRATRQVHAPGPAPPRYRPRQCFGCVDRRLRSVHHPGHGETVHAALEPRYWDRPPRLEPARSCVDAAPRPHLKHQECQPSLKQLPAAFQCPRPPRYLCVRQRGFLGATLHGRRSGSRSRTGCSQWEELCGESLPLGQTPNEMFQPTLPRRPLEDQDPQQRLPKWAKRWLAQ